MSLSSKVSDENSMVFLTTIPCLYACFRFSRLIFLSFICHQFDYDVLGRWGLVGVFFLYSFCLEFAELLESAIHQIFELFNHYFLDFFLSTSVSFSLGTKTSHILDILIYYRSSCVCLFLTYFLSFL